MGWCIAFLIMLGLFVIAGLYGTAVTWMLYDYAKNWPTKQAEFDAKMQQFYDKIQEEFSEEESSKD